MGAAEIQNLKNKLLNVVVDAADDKRARNTVVMDLRNVSSVTDYFVITSGGSYRQVKGIVDNVIEKGEENGFTLYSKEGYDEGKWVLLDFTDVIVHVFEEEERAFYNLEHLWADAEVYSLDN